jgi:topoisomerase-4 subunit A
MRLRSLRKLEEFEIRKEFDALSSEKASRSRRSWAPRPSSGRRLRWEVEKIARPLFELETELGARRTTFADAPSATSATSTTP